MGSDSQHRSDPGRTFERIALGRSAGQAEVKKAVFDAKAAGITNISLDVMLGTPKQSLASLEETFEFIDKVNVSHISAYMLKIEEGTRFYDIKERLALPNEDTVCEMYLKTISSLKTLGFNQYEISNFSKPSFESRHNTKYWILDDYLGLGKSAHSFWGGKRFYYDTDWSLKSEGEVDYEEELKDLKTLKKWKVMEHLMHYLKKKLSKLKKNMTN